MGRFACPHSSASIASRVQVRATPRRISRTRELGADSAHCRHSAARSLHFSGLSIATPSGGPPIRKIKPRLDRGDQRGFLRSASAGAKLFSKLGTHLIVPRYLTASTKNFFAFGVSLLSRVAINCLELATFFRTFEGAIDAPPGPDNTPDRPVSGIDKDRPEYCLHRWNDACLQPKPHPPQCRFLSRYGELRHADGQQLRLGTIPCASDGTVFSIPRAATPQRHREAGQARGGFPSQSLSNRRFLPDVIDPPLH